MQKISYNDKYGLTNAVLEGRKTMTRRLVKSDNIVSTTTSDGAVHHVNKTFGSYHEYMDKDGKVWLAWSPYKVGEVVAVAQAYKDLDYSLRGFATNPDRTCGIRLEYAKKQAGWNNKMFVSAKFMPHQIQITDIKLERLQDISEEDCLKEGIQEYFPYIDRDPNDKVRTFQYFKDGKIHYRISPASKCFAYLIDDILGKGTWERNPWVMAHSFELV